MYITPPVFADSLDYESKNMLHPRFTKLNHVSWFLLQNERQMHKSDVALRKEINALSSMLYKSGMPPQNILKQVLKSGNVL